MEDLERLVADTGGRVVLLSTLDAAGDAFGEILDEIRGQYVLGYYPPERRGPGSQHRVVVRVSGRVAGRGIDVRARSGYVEE
jgi:hypothetical protein